MSGLKCSLGESALVRMGEMRECRQDMLLVSALLERACCILCGPDAD